MSNPTGGPLLIATVTPAAGAPSGVTSTPAQCRARFQAQNHLHHAILRLGQPLNLRGVIVRLDFDRAESPLR